VNAYIMRYIAEWSMLWTTSALIVIGCILNDATFFLGKKKISMDRTFDNFYTLGWMCRFLYAFDERYY